MALVGAHHQRQRAVRQRADQFQLEAFGDLLGRHAVAFVVAVHDQAQAATIHVQLFQFLQETGQRHQRAHRHQPAGLRPQARHEAALGGDVEGAGNLLREDEGLAAQARRLQHRQFVQPRTLRQRQHETFAGQVDGAQLIRQRHRRAQVGQVDLPLQQQPRQFGHRQFADIQADARLFLAEGPDLALQGAGVHRRGHIAQFDMPAIATPGALRGQLRGIELAHRLLGLHAQRLAGGGQAHRALGAVEQADTEGFLQVLDLPAQGRRGDAQLFGGTGEMPMPGDTEEVPEMADFHNVSLACGS
ncbi:MAG: hypothetical protein GAK45_02307 [Pseudomonas citronellolis]|nr:MAG: hypothetical protein GAK45_02307 [Pseudomonas citronellolis]